MKRLTLCTMGLLAAWTAGVDPAFAAGTLQAAGSTQQPIEIQDHHVKASIYNGFARTEISQIFFNPNGVDLEGVYVCPVPKSASLSELTIVNGEQEIRGEVLEKQRARQVYEEARDQGDDAGLAEKDAFQTFRFSVAPIRSGDFVRVRVVYYQPIAIDTGVGRYVYPLEDGGTDEAAKSFWLRNEKVEQTLRFELDLESSWPVVDARMPGYEQEAAIQDLGDGRWRASLQLQNASLNRDLVFYYRLADNLPGRVEMTAFRDDDSRPGSFMLTVTPGLDLQPLNRGVDYAFVLDVSGSMKGKLATLADGVAKALGDMSPADRFRVTTFESRARELTSGWVDATPDNAADMIDRIRALRAGGGTNLYDGLNLALRKLDDDRATSIILVTDAATNTGVIEPAKFHELMKRYDLRVFGFLLGSNGNFPLMRMICDASGGYWTQVSNADDILGQILLAKSKVLYESLHDVSLEIEGVETFDVAKDFNGKVYRGQQLTVFGRYKGSGEARVRLKARMTGEDKVYETAFAFPERADAHPELERLWAMSLIEDIETRQNAGLVAKEEAEGRIRQLGVDYQLVTDYTSMVALSDERFEALGVARHNRDRTARENDARAARSAQPVQPTRVDDAQPMFDGAAPSTGRGGGAFDPLTAGLAALFVLAAALLRRRS